MSELAEFEKGRKFNQLVKELRATGEYLSVYGLEDFNNIELMNIAERLNYVQSQLGELAE